jgi:hypothetical protein
MPSAPFRFGAKKNITITEGNINLSTEVNDELLPLLAPRGAVGDTAHKTSSLDRL